MICNKQQLEPNLILSLREKGTNYKDIKFYMERYTGRKWFISFIHKLIKIDKDEKLYLKQFELSKSKEMMIRDELKQIKQHKKRVNYTINKHTIYRFKVAADKDMRKMSNIVVNLIRRHVASRV